MNRFPKPASWDQDCDPETGRPLSHHQVEVVLVETVRYTFVGGLFRVYARRRGEQRRYGSEAGHIHRARLMLPESQIPCGLEV